MPLGDLLLQRIGTVKKKKITCTKMNSQKKPYLSFFMIYSSCPCLGDLY